MKIINKSVKLNDGREISIETGKLAKQADGAVVVRMGDTMLLSTVVSAKEAQPGVDFMPLQVSYKEEFSSLGRFPGGFMKREGRPTDDEILTCRLVDRALRPLFPADYHADTFVTISLISAEEGVLPDALAGLAASAALAVSDIPFEAHISEVRVCRINGEFVSNPTIAQMAEADMELVVGATYDNILMVEGECKEVSEQEMIDAIKYAHEEIKKHCKLQEELAAELGIVKREYCHEVNNQELEAKVSELSYEKVLAVAKQGLSKHERGDAFAAIKEEVIAALELNEEEHAEELGLVAKYYHDVEKKAMRDMILNDAQRLDGRRTDEVRPIWSEVSYLPGAHGSAVFTRGETQSLTTVTLGSKLDEKIIDSVLVQGKERFVLHYNFPPFSTGDARPQRGVGRREIGHGNLAMRALKNMIPVEKECPYTVRVVSNILESNGSSSMATVCAGSLALMDAGVQIKKPVTGIAMGLISDVENDNFAVLSDILGDEDHLGDMDFKVTGTRDGITATQMDIKVDGLPYPVLEKALMQAKEGRLHIMDKIEETMTQPREDYKPNVPRIVQIEIPKDCIGAVIGPGGKVIQELQERTSTTITIEEVDDKGVVQIHSKDAEGLRAALETIKGITAKPEIGAVYQGKVKSITNFGAFVEFMPGKEALLHVSEIDWKRIEKVEEVLKEGQEIEVKLIGADKKTGKLKLSRKVLLERPPRKPRPDHKKSEDQKEETAKAE